MTRDTIDTIGQWAALALGVALAALLATIAMGQDLGSGAAERSPCGQTDGNGVDMETRVQSPTAQEPAAPTGQAGERPAAVPVTAHEYHRVSESDNRAKSGQREISGTAPIHAPTGAGARRAGDGAAGVRGRAVGGYRQDERLALCFWAEAGPHAHADHAAIAHAVGRWSALTGRPYHVTLEATCHGLRGGAARVAAERRKSWGPAAWERVLTTARAYFAGELANPCPGASHWGGYHRDVDKAMIDAKLAAGVLVEVACGVETKNRFYRGSRRDRNDRR